MTESEFFKEREEELSDQQTHILHEVYVNAFDARQAQLMKLNTRFSLSFQSITWFTYRDNLEIELADSNLKGDSGWGCMLRTG